MKQSAIQQSSGDVGFYFSIQPTQLKIFDTNPSVLDYIMSDLILMSLRAEHFNRKGFGLFTFCYIARFIRAYLLISIDFLMLLPSQARKQEPQIEEYFYKSLSIRELYCQKLDFHL